METVSAEGLRALLNDHEGFTEACTCNLSKFDANRDGVLDFAEVCQLSQAMSESVKLDPPKEDRLRRAFEHFDRNSDGVIDMHEFGIFFRKYLDDVCRRLDAIDAGQALHREFSEPAEPPTRVDSRPTIKSEIVWPPIIKELPGSAIKMDHPAREEYEKGYNLHHQVHPDLWCVTKEDVEEFVRVCRMAQAANKIPNDYEDPNHDNPDIGPNIHAVVKYVIAPITAAFGGMSWSLMRRPGGTHCRAFATHSWREGVYEFCQKIARCSNTRGHHGFYICFLANPQCWSRDDLRCLLGNDPLSSPFAQALASARFLFVVPNSVDNLFMRGWCVLEVYVANQLKIRTQLPGLPKSPEREKCMLQLHQGFTTVESASCSVEDDWLFIRQVLGTDSERINSMIFQIIKDGYAASN